MVSDCWVARVPLQIVRDLIQSPGAPQGVGHAGVDLILEVAELLHVAIGWLIEIGQRIDARLQTVDLGSVRLDPASLNS